MINLECSVKWAVITPAQAFPILSLILFELL
jgi:hypothetical protein